MKSKNKKTAITFGRFSVVTVAHFEFVKSILDKWDRLTIGILFNSQEKNVNNSSFIEICNKNWVKVNPLSTEEKIKLWMLALDSENLTNKVSLVKTQRPELFPAKFNKNYPKELYNLVFPTTKNENNKFDLERNKNFIKILNRDIIEVDVKYKLHFSKILKEITNEDEWGKYLAKGCFNYFKKINGHDRFKKKKLYKMD